MLLRDVASERDLRATGVMMLACPLAPVLWAVLLALQNKPAGASAATVIPLAALLGTLWLVPGLIAWSLWRFYGIGRWLTIMVLILMGIGDAWVLSWFESLGQVSEAFAGNPLFTLAVLLGIPCLGGVLWSLLRPGARRVCLEEYHTVFAAQLGTETRWWTSWIFWAACPVTSVLANALLWALARSVIC